MERALILSRGPALLVDRAFVAVPGDRPGTAPATRPAPAAGATATTLAAAEAPHILRVCHACGWRIKGPRRSVWG